MVQLLQALSALRQALVQSDDPMDTGDQEVAGPMAGAGAGAGRPHGGEGAGAASAVGFKALGLPLEVGATRQLALALLECITADLDLDDTHQIPSRNQLMAGPAGSSSALGAWGVHRCHRQAMCLLGFLLEAGEDGLLRELCCANWVHLAGPGLAQRLLLLADAALTPRGREPGTCVCECEREGDMEYVNKY